MKLVIVTPYFYPKVGGLENYALEIAKGLQKKNWQVTVITSNHESQGYRQEEYFGLEIHRLPIAFKVSNTPVNHEWQKQIKKMLEKERPDIVNAHLPVPFMADMAVVVARSLQIPVVTTYHNDIVKDSFVYSLISSFYYQLLGRMTLNSSSKIIATSSFYASNSRYLKQHLDKTEIVPPGIWLQKITPSNKKVDPYVLFVGQLDTTHRHKGLDYLIKAFVLLKTSLPDLNLIIVGKGDDLSYYQSLIDENDVSANVKLAGFVPNAELHSLYQNALCLCLPSTSDAEGFGMVVIEAAAQRTPSIGSNIGGIAESILNGETGILVSPREPREIADAIERLFVDPSIRNQLGQNAYKRVKRHFTWQHQIEKTHQVFSSLL